MVDADRMETLRGFGLGPYASRAYLALLELGPSDARSVSREARIPAPKVYGTLQQLMERGLVRLIVDTPRRYEPVAFGDYLEQERAGHLEEAQRLARLAPSLSQMFPTGGNGDAKKGASDRGGVHVLRGRQPILRLHRQLASRVGRELILVPSRGAVLRTSTLSALLADCASSGVRARVLLPPEAPSEVVETLRALADVRTIAAAEGPIDSVTTACFDGQEIVLTHHVPDDESAQDGLDVAVHITEEAIARTIHQGLDARWNAALGPKRVGERAARRARSR